MLVTKLIDRRFRKRQDESDQERSYRPDPLGQGVLCRFFPCLQVVTSPKRQDSERSRREGESAYNVLMRTSEGGGAIRSSRKLPLVLQVRLLIAIRR